MIWANDLESNPLDVARGCIGHDNFKLSEQGKFGSHNIIRIVYYPNLDFVAIKAELQARLDTIEWVFVTTGTVDLLEGTFPAFGIAPIQHRKVAVAYHATRQAVVLDILHDGLLPSNPIRRATTFSDTDGVIHVCEKLRCGSGENDCAEWWRNELSKKNRFEDPYWTIVRIDLDGLEEARIYQDMHSQSGIVIDRIERIPPERITLVD